MQLILTKPVKWENISGLLHEFWCVNEVYVGRDKISTSFNTVYDYWDIRVKRGVLYKDGRGHGTVDGQIDTWNKNMEKIRELHPVSQWSEDWSWEPVGSDVFIPDNYRVSNDMICCPSVRFFIDVPKEEQKS